MKQFIICYSLLIGSLAGSSLLHAQDRDPDRFQKIVESKNYIFKAEMALPQQGRSRQITPEFDMAVTGDSVISYLPYFGRAYIAPVNPSEGGIKFTSTQFDYKTDAKKDQWEIIIIPKDAGSVQQLVLTIFDNGRATLRVNDRNRQAISFNGYITEGREKPKKAF